jgi:hypothetical protein
VPDSARTWREIAKSAAAGRGQGPGRPEQSARGRSTGLRRGAGCSRPPLQRTRSGLLGVLKAAAVPGALSPRAGPAASNPCWFAFPYWPIAQIARTICLTCRKEGPENKARLDQSNHRSAPAIAGALRPLLVPRAVCADGRGALPLRRDAAGCTGEHDCEGLDGPCRSGPSLQRRRVVPILRARIQRGCGLSEGRPHRVALTARGPAWCDSAGQADFPSVTAQRAPQAQIAARASTA